MSLRSLIGGPHQIRSMSQKHPKSDTQTTAPREKCISIISHVRQCTSAICHLCRHIVQRGIGFALSSFETTFESGDTMDSSTDPQIQTLIDALHARDDLRQFAMRRLLSM